MGIAIAPHPDPDQVTPKLRRWFRMGHPMAAGPAPGFGHRVLSLPTSFANPRRRRGALLRDSNGRARMKKTWVVVANASQARCYRRETVHSEWITLAEFEDPL